MTDTKEQKLIAGLTSSPKYIPAWYKYDSLGSELELDCRDTAKNNDYYLYRCMTSCLKSNIQDIVPNKETPYKLIDLGSGNCSKTRYVIDQLLKAQTQLSFYPLDISKEFLMRTVDILHHEYGRQLVIHPTAENYVNGIEKFRQLEGPKLILWFNAILNLTYHDQVETLRLISDIMTDDCHLIFSTDITQDQHSILKAYNDKNGLHKKLFLNTITRLNREYGSEVNPDLFRYVMDFVSDPNSDMSYVRAYIQATQHVTFPIPGLGLRLEMERDERLYLHESGTGVSCKYTMDQIRTLTNRAGLKLANSWTDDQNHAVICRCEKM
ncbi:histidine N-alpha-methyltransferase-like isoform X2 [Argopecten irradians]